MAGAVRVRALAVALLALGGCGGAAVRQRPAQAHFVVDPVTARVTVDDRMVGTGRALARLPVDLGAGKHLVTVTAEGHFPHDFELTLVPGVTEVKVSLRKVPE